MKNCDKRASTMPAPTVLDDARPIARVSRFLHHVIPAPTLSHSISTLSVRSGPRCPSSVLPVVHSALVCVRNAQVSAHVAFQRMLCPNGMNSIVLTEFYNHYNSPFVRARSSSAASESPCKSAHNSRP